MANNNTNNPGSKGKYTGEDAKNAQSVADSAQKIAAAVGKLPDNFRMQSELLSSMVGSMKELASEAGSKNLASVSDSMKSMVESINAMDVKKLELLAQLGTNSQAAISSLSISISELSKNIDKISPKPVANLNKKMQESSTQAKKAKKEYTSLGHYLKEEYAVSVSAATGAMSGLIEGLKGTFALLGSGLSLIGSFASSIFEIGKSILAIPFKLFNGLIDMAHKGANGVSELATAINNIRKEFGSLKEPLSKTIMSGAREMKGFAASGLSAFRVFGNVAERMELLTKLFVEGGAALRNLYKEINDNTGAIMGYQRGLGLTDEQMGVVALKAQTMGSSMKKILNNLTKQSYSLGKAFDVDAKIISKGMAQAMQNVRAFGNTSEKSIGVAVTYAHKLGIDLDKITGSLDSFATFDQAADNVSKLNEAFGTNIDAAEMMNAETPADQMEIVRKAFRAAGVEGEKLTRAQRSLLQQTTSWDDATTMAAFSTKNYGVSLSKMKKQATDADRAVLSQTEAMKQLADAMERNLKAGQEMQGGFLDVFLKGFSDGIQSTQEFRDMMIAIKQALVVVYREGMRLGKLFVEKFPGIKDLFVSIKGFFDPKKFKDLASGVVNVFVEFFKKLQDPKGKGSFNFLMTELKKKFLSFFDQQTPQGKKVVESFKKIFVALRTIVAEGIKWIGERLVDGIKFITSFIKNPSAALSGVSGQASEFAKFFEPIIDSIKEVGPKLWDALVDLFKTAFDKLKDWFMSTALPLIQPYIGKMLMVLFGPALIRGVLTGLGSGLTAGFGKIAGSLFDKFMDKKKGAIADAAKKVVEAQNNIPGTPSGKGGPVPEAINSASKIDVKEAEQTQGLSKISWPEIVAVFLGIALLMGVGLLVFYAAAQMVDKMDESTVIKAMMVLLTVSAAILPLALSAFIISKMPAVDYASIIKNLLAIGFVALALGAFGVAIAALASVVDEQDITKAGLLLGIMTAVAIALSLVVMGLMVVGASVGGPQALTVAVGLAAIGIVMVALALFGKLLVTKVKEMGFTEQEITTAGLFMEVAGKAVVYAAAGALAAIGVGWAVITSGAVGAVAGFAAVSIMLKKMTDTTTVIVEQSKLIPDGSEEKAKILVDIFKTIVEAMGVLPAILDKMDFHWWESSEKQAKKIENMTNMIKAIFGQEKDAGGRSGLIGLIELIYEASGKLKTEQIAAAQALGPILSGAAQLMQSIMGPLADVQKTTSTGYVHLASTDNKQMKDMMQKFKDLVVGKPGEPGLIDSVGALISGVVKTIAEVNLNNDQVEKVKAVAPLVGSSLEASAKITEAITSATKSMTKEYSNKEGSKLKEVDKEGIREMTKSVLDIIKTISGPEGISGVVSSIITLISGTNLKKMDKETIEKAKAIFSVISSVTSLSSALQNYALESGKTAIQGGNQATNKGFFGGLFGDGDEGMKNIKNLQKSFPSLSALLTELQINLPPLVGAILQAISTIKDKKLSAKDLKDAVAIFDIIKNMSGLVEAASKVPPAPPVGGESSADIMVRNLDQITLLIKSYFGGKNKDLDIFTVLKDTAGNIRRNANFAADANLMISTLETLKKFIAKVQEVQEAGGGNLKDLASDFSSGAATLLENMSHNSVVRTAIFGLKEKIKLGAEDKNHIQVIIDYLSKISEMIGALAGMNAVVKTSLGQGGEGATEVTKNMEALAKLFSDIGEKTKPLTDGKQKLIDSFSAIEEIASKINSVAKSPNFQATTMRANMMNITTSTSTLKTVLSTVADNIRSISTDVSSLTLDEIQSSIDTVDNIVNAAARIENSLAAGAEVDIDTKLKVFAGKFGKMMGSKGAYSVKTKDVKVTVNLNVAMDATELENIMITSNESIISNRINLLMDAIAPQEYVDTDKWGIGGRALNAVKGLGDSIKSPFKEPKASAEDAAKEQIKKHSARIHRKQKPKLIPGHGP